MERSIDRSTLLDVAPDRESLLCSNKSIEELRQVLKIRVGLSTGHWLHRRRQNPNPNMLGAAARISTFMKGTTGGMDDSKLSNNGLHQAVRRVSSASSVSPLSKSNTIFSFKNGFFVTPDEGFPLDIWGTPLLSTTDKLISPRPLGPTHILLVHAHSVPSTFVIGTTARRTKKHTASPKVIELPINDLLFLMSVPNLTSGVPALPRRLHKELPRVVMYVPHLATFPELVIYLHTMNQAELFRALIPEWIRDLMHPLPSLALNSGGIAEAEKNTSCKARQLFGIFGCRRSPNHTSYVKLLSLSEGGRTINSISREICEIAATAEGSGNDPVLHAACLLDALRDNLDYIGYYGQALWNELDICREILVRAVSWKAKIDNYDQKE